jgi:hypothetical protein
MCTAKTPKAPRASTPPPPPSAEVIDPLVLAERERERGRQRGARGRQSTILASRAQNYMPPTGQQKTALGA